MAIVTINDEHLTNIADAIRRKNGTDNTYTPDKMADAIKDIQGGAEPVLEEVMVFPKTEEMIITPSSDYDGISKVIVNPVTSDIDSDIKSANIKKGVNILGVTGTLEEGITPSGTLNITENGIETKGDNNEDIDSFVTKNNNFVGKTLFSIPYIGYAIVFLKKPFGLSIIIAVLLVLVLLNIKDMAHIKKTSVSA